jgi:hypothetical protein
MQRKIGFIGVMVLVVVAAPSSSTFAEPTDCATCHAAQQQQLTGSVHAKVRCQECHGGAESYASAPVPANSDRERGDALPSFDHGPSFSGEIQRAQVPRLCGDCHADVARMNPFGLRTDQLTGYWTSGHGKALKERGETRVAICVDCHGSHDVLKPTEATSKTNPMNVPDTCATCHADDKLMSEFDLPAQLVDEYRRSIHGELLLVLRDAGAPTCATCHGNHAAAPPGFASVGAVCGRCHQHAAQHFADSIHAQQESFHGCVQCHGGGPKAHFHHIERITKPGGVLIQRYAHLLISEPAPTAAQVAQALHPDPKEIMTRALPGCTDCHEELSNDESLQKLFHLIDTIADAEHKYVQTAGQLDRVGRGVLLVEQQRFKFETATTHLIALAPLQHALNNDLVAGKVAELNTVCDEVRSDLTQLENGLRLRYQALTPIWIFALGFAAVLYAKYKALRAKYVTPLPGDKK